MKNRDFYTWLVQCRRTPVIGILSRHLLKLLGVRIHAAVPIGQNFRLMHGGLGVVIHRCTKIGANVRIYPGVIVGRADVYLPFGESRFGGFEIGDDVILSSGAKVLCKNGLLKVGRGTIVGANAVLLESTGEYEIWAGSPARCVGYRPRPRARNARAG